MRVLILTKIFPNRFEPHSSPFNRQQFLALSHRCDIELLATVPWFPGSRWFSKWSAAGRLASLPWRDEVAGLPVEHPRFLFVPRIGHGLSGLLYAVSMFPSVAPRRGRVDVVLGSWAYPDGVAAIALARFLGVPCVVKVHGSDINLLGLQAGPKWNMRLVLPHADRIVAVSTPLASRLEALGIAKERIAIVQNGVDSALFRPRDPGPARKRLGLPQTGKIILYVGRLEPPKGVPELLAAFATLAETRSDVSLVLVGSGSIRGASEALASRLPGRVFLMGSRPLEEVAECVAACDVLTLPSWNEGTPNVLLEALAAGRPVVATRVGGIPDVVTSPVLGELVPPRSPAALAEALGRVLAQPHDAEAIVAKGGRGGWDDSAGKLYDVLEAAVARKQQGAASA